MADRSVYDIITDVIVKKLESGVIPWRRPWQTFGDPANLISGKSYRGINHFILGCAGFSSPYFLTFKQAKELGGHVRAGEHGLPCIFWTEWETEDRKTGEDKTIPILRYYRVFNSDQCEGLSHKRLGALADPAAAPPFDPNAQAESVIGGMPRPPRFTSEGAAAYYRPATDTVNVPPRALFTSFDGYYSTVFHELAHSTGHRSRLARKAVAETAYFGSFDYGAEELVAEMSAAFLCAHCRIDSPVIDNQAAYIGSWLRTIRSDARLVVVAAAQAQKAADFILAKGAASNDSDVAH